MRERGAPKLARAVILVPVIGFVVANCSGKRSAADDEDDAGRAGASGATGGRGGRAGGASGGSSGATESGGSGGSSAASSGGVSGAAGEPNGTDAGEGGQPGAGGGTGGNPTGGNGGATGGKGGSSGSGASSGASGSAGTGTTPAVCGNGQTEGDEGCDDANTTDDDGCSANCAVEPGNVCSQAACVDNLCTYVVSATFRDFNAHDVPGGHPDFQPGFNTVGAQQGLIATTLDGEGKPVLLAANTNAYLHSVSDFAEWYRDVPGTNATVAGSVALHGSAGGSFGNRWGKAGEEWSGQGMYGNVVAGGVGTAGGEPGCTLPACDGRTCYDPCTPWGAGQTQACCADDITMRYEGTPLFFPIDGAPGILNETRYEAKIAEQYGWLGWPWESDVAEILGVSTPLDTAFAPFPSPTHNFSFTSELTFRVRYDADVTQVIEIMGDDDIWLFFNGHLAVDLGGWHQPLMGYVNFMGGTVTSYAVVDTALPPTAVSTTAPASSFDLVDGEVYTVSVFHAERQKEGSTFKLRVLGYNLEQSVCAPP